MSEHRLIDANALKDKMSNYHLQVEGYRHDNKIDIMTKVAQAMHDNAIKCISDSQTIDPETLPIVRELREANLKAECRADALMAKILVLEEELKQVAEERDAAVEQLHGKCYACKHNDTPFHSSGQRDEYKSALQNWHEDG